MSQVAVRISDRVVVGFASSLPSREGCEILTLTDDENRSIWAALNQSRGNIAAPGNIYLAVDGTITADPPQFPPPPPGNPASFSTAVAKLKSTFGTARSQQDINLCLDAITVILRRIHGELQ